MPDYGGFAAIMRTEGGIALSNDNGVWNLSASLQITPPASFSNFDASGNIYIYVNGVNVGAMSLHDMNDDYPNGTISVPGTMTLVGPGNGFNFSNLNSGDTVTLEVRTGCTTWSGTDNFYTNDKKSYTLTIE